MNIGKFSIKNKYFILSSLIAIIIFGIYGRGTMKTELAPDTNPPMATVITQYPGTSAQDVVTDVVEPMEEEFGKLEGIKNVKSTSQDNIATIQLEFDYKMNIDEATIDIQNAISRIRQDLPQNIMEPRVLKFSTSDKPIMTISLNSKSLNMQNIRQLAEDKISYDMELVDGVASVELFGGYNNEIQIKIDKNELIAYGLSLEQVSNAIAQDNIKAPGGKILHDNKDMLIRIEESFQTIDDIKKLTIPLKDGNFVYLQDIADIDLSIKKLESSYGFNGKEAIAMLVTKRSDSNTVEVINNVKQKLDELQRMYPFIEFQIAQDDSIFTRQMVDNMSSSVLMSILLTAILMSLFITKVNQSLVVSLSMPIVFLSTLTLMRIFDMSLDMVTLSALILSIGFVVDGAIVSVENIITHYNQYGKDIVTATIDAINEISMPSLAGATTTLIVLVPLIFIKGFVGEMFRPLSMTLIFAIGSSVVVALTIIPLLTVMFNKIQAIRLERIINVVALPFNRMMEKLLKIYTKLLKIVLINKAKTYIIIIILMAMSAGFLANKGVEMLPKFDSGVTYVSIEMEPGTTVEDTRGTIHLIEKLLDKEKNVVNYSTQIGYEHGSNQLGDFGIMGANQGVITINLNTRKERKETIWEFQERLRKEIDTIPDIKRFVVKEQGGTAVGSSSAPIDIKISGDDQEVLYHIALDLEEKIKTIEGTTNIYKSFDIDNIQLNIMTDDKRIQELGLNNINISRQIYSAIEGIQNTTMNVGESKNIDISVKYMDKYVESLDNLLDVYVESPLGVKVPLREIVSIDVIERSNIITKENLKYTINILGYTYDRAFSHIVKDINAIMEGYPLPTGYSMGLTGEQETLADSMKDMIFLVALAIIFVYLLLVPQFKSFIHPITIMASIPLVIIGVAPALAISNTYISMPVLLGFILLAGTVVNNAILLIDHMISNRAKGVAVEESAIVAITARFRPIMMTAFSDIVGMLPLALQLALGSERFSPLAITVIGGMLAATFLTMIVIPLIYVTFERLHEKLRKQVLGS